MESVKFGKHNAIGVELSETDFPPVAHIAEIPAFGWCANITDKRKRHPTP